MRVGRLEDAYAVRDLEVARISSRTWVERHVVGSRGESALDVACHGLHVRDVAARVVCWSFVEEDAVDVDVLAAGVALPACVGVDFGLDVGLGAGAPVNVDVAEGVDIGVGV